MLAPKDSYKLMATDTVLQGFDSLIAEIKRQAAPTIRMARDSLKVEHNYALESLVSKTAALRAAYIEKHYPEIVGDLLYSTNM